eukprot:Gregarina_sp_Pseudo_9__16@NODE_1010_length_1970_cov_97_988089_g947_i0_p2_GENE_NODE_1010_length_1970_cov_97_988089_g947_i0NODE_1010_length_1970_cov_97_988089_g947_i0_p2_ORF_typecomplete_len231_score7_44_NODE_1010_length_1970_cov_97_988089_g947_i010261718
MDDNASFDYEANVEPRQIGTGLCRKARTELCRWELDVLKTLLLISVVLINVWAGVAVVAESVWLPYTAKWNDNPQGCPSSALMRPVEAAAETCLQQCERRKAFIQLFTCVWMCVALVQGSSLLSVLLKPQQSPRARLLCGQVVVATTLIMVSSQIYMFREWMTSPCDGSRVNVLESLMNRGMFVSQVFTILLAWHIFFRVRPFSHRDKDRPRCFYSKSKSLVSSNEETCA